MILLKTRNGKKYLLKLLLITTIHMIFISSINIDFELGDDLIVILMSAIVHCIFPLMTLAVISLYIKYKKTFLENSACTQKDYKLILIILIYLPLTIRIIKGLVRNNVGLNFSNIIILIIVTIMYLYEINTFKVIKRTNLRLSNKIDSKKHDVLINKKRYKNEIYSLISMYICVIALIVGLFYDFNVLLAIWVFNILTLFFREKNRKFYLKMDKDEF